MTFKAKIGGVMVFLAAMLGLAAPMANATTTTAATEVAQVRPTGEIGTMSEGGYDRDHWWFKISKAELISIGAGAACRAALGAAGTFACPPIALAIDAALAANPNISGGFWGELYTNGQVRVGTW